MTKKWSSTASMDGKTKRQASKDARREFARELHRLDELPPAVKIKSKQWLAEKAGDLALEVGRLKVEKAATIERCAERAYLFLITGNHHELAVATRAAIRKLKDE